MLFHKPRTGPAGVCGILAGCALFVLILSTWGCSSVSNIGKRTKGIVKGFYDTDKGLKKRVGISFFDNRTRMESREVKQRLLDFISQSVAAECSQVAFVSPGDDRYPDALRELPVMVSGRLDNLALAETGRLYGLNAVVTGALVALDKENEEKGMLWFKSIRNYVRVGINVEIYDTETGAKLLDETFSHRSEIEEMDLEALMTDAQVQAKILQEAFKEISSDMGEAVCEALARSPWRGYVRSVQGGRVMISSGSRAGLKAGDVLEVYPVGQIIQGAQGQQFFIPGGKTGEIKVTTVSEESSEAEFLSGEAVKTGSALRPKP